MSSVHQQVEGGKSKSLETGASSNGDAKTKIDVLRECALEVLMKTVTQKAQQAAAAGKFFCTVDVEKDLFLHWRLCTGKELEAKLEIIERRIKQDGYRVERVFPVLDSDHDARGPSQLNLTWH